MRTIKTIITYFCITLAASSTAQVRGWRGIVPLHSTCDDVKRLLGVTTCEPSTYHLKDETVTIMFSEKPCLDGWNVPSGTVMTIDVHPKPGLKLADFHIDESKYRKEADQHLEGVSYYKDDEEGVSITVLSDGSIGGSFYGPAARDSYLRYPVSSAGRPDGDGNSHGSVKFDEYGNLTIKEQQDRLNNFALQLQSEPNTQGYIIAYGGRRARVGEAQARAASAKNYLVNKLNIKKERIVTVDGGYREELTVELFIRLDGGTAPIRSPTVCPSEVKIFKSRARNNDRRSSRPRR